MKKFFLPILSFSLLIACNSGGSKEEKQIDKKETSTEVADISANPDYQKGLGILAKNDCLTCHKVDEMLTGPAYRDVANKYAGVDTAVSYLAKKIISGGSGVWGSEPMPAQAHVPGADIRAIAEWLASGKF